MSKIYVVSEIIMAEGAQEEYLQLAAGIKDELAKTEGFIRSERFESLMTERKLLSLSVWESMEAAAKWRANIAHRHSQQRTREKLFESYRISVLSLEREYTESDRGEAPKDSNAYFKL